MVRFRERALRNRERFGSREVPRCRCRSQNYPGIVEGIPDSLPSRGTVGGTKSRFCCNPAARHPPTALELNQNQRTKPSPKLFLTVVLETFAYEIVGGGAISVVPTKRRRQTRGRRRQRVNPTHFDTILFAQAVVVRLSVVISVLGPARKPTFKANIELQKQAEVASIIPDNLYLIKESGETQNSKLRVRRNISSSS